MTELEKRIGYGFKDTSLLEAALVTPSCRMECPEMEDNQRLEFLGDAVLSIIVSDYLFRRYHMAEGDLTKLRAALVCERSLSRFAAEIGLGEALLLGRGEEQTGGRSRPSVLADAFEAVIAAYEATLALAKK